MPGPSLAPAVDLLALATGTLTAPPHKIATNYVYVADKFTRAGLTPAPGAAVGAPWVVECPVAMEGTVTEVRPFGGVGSGVVSVEVEITQTRVMPELLLTGSDRHIDSDLWDPLISGHTTRLEPSVLAHGCQIPAPGIRRQ